MPAGGRGGPGAMPRRCCESAGALSQGRVAPLVPGLEDKSGWEVLPGGWGAATLCPPSSSTLRWRLCSVPWGGMASMKGLLSSCSPGSTAAASPSRQTNSQCWAHGRGRGGSPHPAQAAVATVEPGAPAGPSIPMAWHGAPSPGVGGCWLGCRKLGALLTPPRAHSQP